MPAKLPDDLVAKPDPVLSDTAVGETVLVECFSLRVIPNGDCYLKPEASVKPTRRNLLRPLQVQRASDGYHVTILSPHPWTKDASEKIAKDHIPVASITVAFDEESKRWG